MAFCVPVFAGNPAVPGFLHNVAGLAEVRVMLHIVVQTGRKVATNGNSDYSSDNNRYSHRLREPTHPLPETSCFGSEPVHVLSSFSIGQPNVTARVAGGRNNLVIFVLLAFRAHPDPLLTLREVKKSLSCPLHLPAKQGWSQSTDTFLNP